jgi:cysteine desulfurase / selenocysteine lyase
MARVIEEAGRQGGVATLYVERIRADFPLLRRTVNGKPLVYLNSAATSQKPEAVIDAITDFYRNHNANVHRGVDALSEEATELFEGARARLAGFVGAPEPSCIVFNRGTTESINLVAHGWGRKVLREGDEVLITQMEHHSNLIPWLLATQATGSRLRYIPIREDGTLDLSSLDSLLTERTKIVSVTGMSNVLGTIPPVRKLAEAAHAVGAVLCVDGAQLVCHTPVDVVDLGVDFLTISGHKMLGPTASGGLYARRELLEEMDPFLGGGEMIREVYWDRATWAEVPWKFEAGTMNVAQEVGLAAAIDYLEALGMQAVRRHEEELAAYAMDRLGEAGAKVFGPADPAIHSGAVSFWYKDIHPHDLATVLDQEGVAVRAGHHCAQPLMRLLGVPATVRASFYVYNRPDEVDALIEGLRRAERLFGVA